MTTKKIPSTADVVDVDELDADQKRERDRARRQEEDRQKPMSLSTEALIQPGTADYALAEVMRELSTVAQGAAATKLRNIVSQVFPADREQAVRFMEIVRRLRNATEAVEQQAVAESARR